MAAITSVDLNSDLGEGYGPYALGDDAAMLALVSSANIACGGHASDPDTMYRTLCLARDRGVVVGAHPGYPDRQYFGRRDLPYTPDEITRFTAAQTGALIAMAKLAGTAVSYVKPHGALNNRAATMPLPPTPSPPPSRPSTRAGGPRPAGNRARDGGAPPGPAGL